MRSRAHSPVVLGFITLAIALCDMLLSYRFFPNKTHTIYTTHTYDVVFTTHYHTIEAE